MAGSEDHIKTLRLFDLSFLTVTATKPEKEHLRRCKECRNALAAFTRQFSKEKRSP
jgi:hypothetical protein